MTSLHSRLVALEKSLYRPAPYTWGWSDAADLGETRPCPNTWEHGSHCEIENATGRHYIRLTWDVNTVLRRPR